MLQVTSKDGTKIAFVKTGRGPVVLMVNGALAFREFYGGEDLGTLLSDDFTFIDYDRRGRGESSDASSYEVAREIEDIEELIDEAGGPAYVIGSSSGAALALLAAAKLGPGKIKKLALYEPPYGSDSDKDKKEAFEQTKQMNKLIANNKRAEALSLFLGDAAPEVLADMKKSPEWKVMESVAHTLPYEYAIMGNGAVPVETARTINVPTLVMDGEESPQFMHDAADTLAKALPNVSRRTLKGQTHQVSADVIAPLLKEFFTNKNG